jgi:hypothetical protein
MMTDAAILPHFPQAPARLNIAPIPVGLPAGGAPPFPSILSAPAPDVETMAGRDKPVKWSRI